MRGCKIVDGRNCLERNEIVKTDYIILGLADHKILVGEVKSYLTTTKQVTDARTTPVKFMKKENIYSYEVISEKDISEGIIGNSR